MLARVELVGKNKSSMLGPLNGVVFRLFASPEGPLSLTKTDSMLQ